ncbi:MAG: hydrogen peroxide-inducible genes activator, partial [Phenylobacterium sp.]|nr:hydrogen peroxide-inducible genes activator [Phenylobacterium sp.]
ANVAVKPIAAEHAVREIVVAWRAGSNRRAEGRLLADVLRDV